MRNKDLVIIGGGPAGLAAAISAYETGVKDIVVVEREKRLGGILRQCIHDGFGLHKFNKAYTGPEYAHKYVQEIKGLDIELLTETIAIKTKTIAVTKTVIELILSQSIFHEFPFSLTGIWTGCSVTLLFSE